MEVVESARKHGVADADILHAFRNAVRVHVMDGYLIVVGAARDGNLLEIGHHPATDRIFHAMPARAKYVRGR